MKVEKYSPTEAEVAAYNPQTSFGVLREMDDFVNRMFDSFWHEPAFLNSRNWRPSEIQEDKDNVYLEIELPRFKREEVKVEVKNRAVSVTAKNNRSSFSRVFGLSGVDYDKIDGKLENGLLTITLPKTPESKSRELALK